MPLYDSVCVKINLQLNCFTFSIYLFIYFYDCMIYPNSLICSKLWQCSIQADYNNGLSFNLNKINFLALLPGLQMYQEKKRVLMRRLLAN